MTSLVITTNHYVYLSSYESNSTLSIGTSSTAQHSADCYVNKVCSLTEAYALFKADNPDIKIGITKFAEFIPKHVLLGNKIPHNVCLCKYHENFISAAEALHKCCPAFPWYSDDLPGKVICSPAT